MIDFDNLFSFFYRFWGIFRFSVDFEVLFFVLGGTGEETVGGTGEETVGESIIKRKK